MIDLYTWTTPNGFKIPIALEEMELAYRTIPVDITAGEQFAPDFLRISPNSKIPAIVDHDGPVSVFESGAILIYLAEKSGLLMPVDSAGRVEVLEWLMFQMSSLGPMMGQAGHFLRNAPDKIPYAIERYTQEVRRLFGVMDRRLAEADYLAGDYSIADISSFPWIRAGIGSGIYDMAGFPHLMRWFDAIDQRPAVERGLAVLITASSAPTPTEGDRDNLLGDRKGSLR